MKKLLLTLIVSLAFGGSIFAQHETHWPEFNNGPFEDYNTIICFAQIDGEYISIQDNWEDFEIAAFVGDECRGHAFMDDYTDDGDPYPSFELYVYFSGNGGEETNFKLYDHSTGTLYEDGAINIEFTTGSGEHIEIIMGDYDNAVVFSFTSPAPAEPTPWGTEFEGDIPTVADDVTIIEDVIIPNGYVAYANEITIEEGATLYIEEGGQLIHNGEVEVTMLMNVVGYGPAKEGNNLGYRLFASPVHSTEANNFIPVEGTNLNTGTYDLYKFDESQDREWINYKLADNNFTNLVLGTGYLYANEASIDNVVLRGFTVPTAENYAVSTELSYTTDAVFKGWNLVGNPYTCNAYVKNGSGYMPYYVLNTNGGIEGTVVAAGTPIALMKGLFVQASATD
jgi:hypothetical protein